MGKDNNRSSDDDDDDDNDDDDDDDDEDDEDDDEDDDNEDEDEVNAKAAKDAAIKELKVQEDIDIIEDIFKYIDETTRRLLHAQMQDETINRLLSDLQGFEKDRAHFDRRERGSEKDFISPAELQNQKGALDPRPILPPPPQPYSPKVSPNAQPNALQSPQGPPPQRHVDREDDDGDENYDDVSAEASMTWSQYEHLDEAGRADLLERAIRVLGQGVASTNRKASQNNNSNSKKK